MNFQFIAAVIVTSLGLFSLLVAAVGAIRLPDFYTRTHALAVMDTLGTLFLLSGPVIYYGTSVVAMKFVFLILFFYFANPAVTNVLIRAALRSGLKPWTEKG